MQTPRLILLMSGLILFPSILMAFELSESSKPTCFPGKAFKGNGTNKPPTEVKIELCRTMTNGLYKDFQLMGLDDKPIDLDPRKTTLIEKSSHADNGDNTYSAQARNMRGMESEERGGQDRLRELGGKVLKDGVTDLLESSVKWVGKWVKNKWGGTEFYLVIKSPKGDDVHIHRLRFPNRYKGALNTFFPRPTREDGDPRSSRSPATGIPVRSMAFGDARLAERVPPARRRRFRKQSQDSPAPRLPSNERHRRVGP